jgi:hypothetical protein
MRRRRRLILLLLLLLLASLLGVAVLDREGARRRDADAAASERASSGATATAPTESAEESSDPAPGGTRPVTQRKRPSGGHTPAPTATADGGSAPGAGSPSSGGTASGGGSSSDDGGEPGAPFTITGNARGLRVGVWTAVPMEITNPNHVAITVTSLRVGVSGSPNGCDAAANFETRASTGHFTVPAGARGYPVPLGNRPLIRLRNLATNQNRCKRQTFTLSFTGSATGS